MSLHEVILERLKHLDKFFVEEGELTGTEYFELVKPLHDALLELAKGIK